MAEIGKLLRDDAKASELRESEFEMFKFFDSCVKSASTQHYKQSLVVLKKLFKDLGIDWYGATHESSAPVRGQLKASLQYGLDLADEIVSIGPHVNKDAAELSMSVAGHFPFELQSKAMSTNDFDAQEMSDLAARFGRKLSDFERLVRDRPNNFTSGNMRRLLRALEIPEFDVRTEKRVGVNSLAVRVFVSEVVSLFSLKPSCKMNYVDEWILGDIEEATRTPLAEILEEYFDDFTVLTDGTRVHACTASAIAGLQTYLNDSYRRMFQDHLGSALLKRFSRHIGGEATRISCDLAKCSKVTEESCSRLTQKSLPFTYFSLIRRSLTTEYTEIRTRYLISSLKLNYAKVLRRQTWMDSGTRHKLMDKLSAIVDHIGSPPHLDRLEPTEVSAVFTSNFLENTLRLLKSRQDAKLSELYRPALRDRRVWPQLEITGVNAYYVSPLNVLLSPSTMLAFPFYDETLDVSRTMATYAFVLAHEMSHGFNPYGAAFGPFGVPEKTMSSESENILLVSYPSR
ncbi:endothelin-converting enzyme 2-like [Galendromus occidentalis]|uniref:Endothelin-converting enzyme 2-like n=1 Tax=Galendromus occidentalis TaxID=34638 RepID=A0AAJ7L4T2_9ACAR|nr:endothelin-converting enzyme 2-like [Galendromus occidentalis]